jgi:hypothetical protein
VYESSARDLIHARPAIHFRIADFEDYSDHVPARLTVSKEQRAVCHHNPIRMQFPERADDQPVKLRTARGGVRVHVAPERDASRRPRRRASYDPFAGAIAV